MALKQLNIRMEEALYADLAEKAGSVPPAKFAMRLIERALRGDLPEVSPEPRVQLRQPQQVRIDPEPILEPMQEIYTLVEEVLIAVHEYGSYLLRSKARAYTHEATVMDARDDARRALLRLRNRNGNGST